MSRDDLFKIENGKIYILNFTTRVWSYFCDGDLDVCERLYLSVTTGVMQKGRYHLKNTSFLLMMPWVGYFKENA